MMENIMSVNAESRAKSGKEYAKKLRNMGKVPAIIYGGGKESIPISLSLNDVKSILKSEKGENTILRIHRDDIKVDAMLKDIQYDYLSDNVIHVDFIRIDLTKPIEIFVPVLIKGESIGVKMEDGIFDFITRELKVRCMPDKIPTAIELDVSDLHLGNSIRVEELEIEKDVRFLSDPKTVICSVSAKGMMEEEVVEEEAEEEVEVAEGEAAEKEEKKEEKDGKAEEPTKTKENE
jgi:large subunit ribosomal protein L25